MKKILIAAALCAASVGALADTTFEFGVTGTIGLIFPPIDGNPAPTYIAEPIAGTASLVISGNGADGTYTYDNASGYPDINSLVSFEMEAGNVNIDTSEDAIYIRGSLTAAVQNGAVTSIVGAIGVQAYPPACGNYNAECFNFNGLSFTDTQSPGPLGYGGFSGTGILTAVPEPSTWALMIGTLALMGLVVLKKPAGNP